ncbi:MULTISPECIES: class III lanthipeptide [Priestia]|nr:MULTISPECIES: class III lanthipeptide [Priestia]MCP1452372.1 hypothetical protein [Priestia megaterium]MDC7767141.1 class III lanthipeptide [Priestia aryabhattai]UPK52832.1 class III lanthipeptide [Bacillus sp. H8-1]WKG33418.1 class III lanthipeptide [Priestia aryabhattai]
MNNVLALQKMYQKEKKKGNKENSSLSLGCSPSSNTSWFLC